MIRVILCNSFLIICVLMLVITGHSSSNEASPETGSLQYRSSRVSVDPVHNKTKKEYCDEVNAKFRHFGWYSIICNPKRWKIHDHSSKGNPLIYQEFGLNDSDNGGPVNLVLCGVHGDESVGVYQCFHLVREILFDNPSLSKEIKIVVAPIVNPDGFFANTRQNANGVDLNRNLPTEDWDRLSYTGWSQNRRDPRKFPGKESGSEIESRFLTYLINRYKPDKIISFHSPLGFLDFDGPGDQKYYNLVRIEHRAKYLGLNIEANTKRFLSLVDFPFFPGSLGNYAGNERKIPTYTVEFKSSDPSRGHKYWSAVRFAIVTALRFTVYDENEENTYLNAQNVMRQLAYAENEH